MSAIPPALDGPLDGNRFAPNTPDNQASSLWIAGILSIIYTSLVLGIRAQLRWRFYGADDYLAASATLLQLAEVAALMVSLTQGIGQRPSTLTTTELFRGNKSAFISQVFFIVSACLAKVSVLALMLRLFNINGPKFSRTNQNRKLWLVGSFIFAVLVVWGIGSLIAVTVDCSATTWVEDTAKCPNQVLRWQLITAFDILTEVLMLVMTILIVLPVHLSLPLKAQVVMAFSFRIPLIAASAVHLHYVGVHVHTDQSHSLSIVPVLATQQVYICWSLISASIPNIKSFVKSFGTGFGIQVGLNGTQLGPYGYHSGSKEGTGRGHELKWLSQRSKASQNASHLASMHDDDIVPRTGPAVSSQPSRDFDAGSKTRKLGNATPRDLIGRRANSRDGSTGSQEMIIRKDVVWTVQAEED